MSTGSGKEVSFRSDKDRPTTAQQHQTRAEENREREVPVSE